MRPKLERTIDGAIGRLLSWWIQPAVRSKTNESIAGTETEAAAKSSLEASPSATKALATSAAETKAAETKAAATNDTAVTKAAVTKAAVTKAAVTKAAVTKAAVTKAAVTSPVVTSTAGTDVAKKQARKRTVAESVATEDEPAETLEPGASLNDAIVAALRTASDGLAMKDLSLRTGAKRFVLRRSLNELMASGQILRKGEGMRTRYHLGAD